MISAAALTILTTPKVGSPTNSGTGAVVQKVHGPLKTTLTLLQDGKLRLCLIASDHDTKFIADALRTAVARQLKLPVSHVLVFSSHAHTICALTRDSFAERYKIKPQARGQSCRNGQRDLLPLGRQLCTQVKRTAGKMPRLLQPVTVWRAVGQEDRFTFNRKGRRADSTCYEIREEDRDLIDTDYRGDIEKDAPVVCLKAADGRPVAFLAQYTGHPLTCYHPERMIVFGDWPQVACDLLARHHRRHGPVPVSFFQGCAGETNSKGMLRGTVAQSRRYGRMLGQTYIDASKRLVASESKRMQFAIERAHVPFKPLPSLRTLLRERAEMENFIHRAEAGDENTVGCVGLNFSQEYTPAYRGKLVEALLPWSDWAIGLHQQGKAHTARKHKHIDINVLQLGDVAMVGIPCEPFLGIGREIKRDSPFALTIPCGYMNDYRGYIPDSPNVGDQDYQSAFYRYTPNEPPFRRPGGSVLATAAVKVLKQFARNGGSRPQHCGPARR